MSSEGQDQLAIETSLALKGTGVTLVGVVFSIAISVAFGIPGPWWLRVLVGGGVMLGLVVLIKVASASRRGPLTRFANWMIGAPNP